MGPAKYQNDGDPRASGPSFGVTVHPSSLTEPLRCDWVRALSDTSLASLPAFFFTQVGGPTSTAGGRDLDGRTWDDYPTHSPEGQSAWPA